MVRKRIADPQAAFDHLPILEIFRVERRALRFQRSCRNRPRDVIQARDGAPLVITDDQKGELLRVTPASATSR